MIFQFALKRLVPLINKDPAGQSLVLVHCNSGLNRSPAVCLVAMTNEAEPEGNYNTVLGNIRRARPGYKVLDSETNKNDFEGEIRRRVAKLFNK